MTMAAAKTDDELYSTMYELCMKDWPDLNKEYRETFNERGETVKEAMKPEIEEAVSRLQAVVELGRLTRERRKVGLKTPLKLSKMFPKRIQDASETHPRRIQDVSKTAFEFYMISERFEIDFEAVFGDKIYSKSKINLFLNDFQFLNPVSISNFK